MATPKSKILLAISGSIAAYKAALLCRLLIKSGYEVRVVMTPSATQFISPLTLSTLSNHIVYSDINDGATWHNHVELGSWADMMLIAPATATTLSKMAYGHADNMVIASYLSAKCPVMFAPAMDLDMWKHPSTVSNIETLKSYGNHYLGIGSGFLASGLEGDGRMIEPEEIVDAVNAFIDSTHDLSGKKVLITAGPTHEAIDPVRFIGNISSGKMGIAIAKECAIRGADVTLVIGPTSEPLSSLKANVIKVTSADQMYQATQKAHLSSDIVIFSAAVADYKVVKVADQKIKKSDDKLTISLQKNIDIAETLGKSKRSNQIHIGFALETDNELLNAVAKVEKKNFNFIILNSLNDKGAGFQLDTNKITIIDKSGIQTLYEVKPKVKVAKDIIDYLVLKYL